MSLKPSKVVVSGLVKDVLLIIQQIPFGIDKGKRAIHELNSETFHVPSCWWGSWFEWHRPESCHGRGAGERPFMTLAMCLIGAGGGPVSIDGLVTSVENSQQCAPNGQILLRRVPLSGGL